MADFKMVRLPNELVARVDAARGLVPREAWVRQALERELLAPEVVASGPVLPDPYVSPEAMVQRPQVRPSVAAFNRADAFRQAGKVKP